MRQILILSASAENAPYFREAFGADFSVVTVKDLNTAQLLLSETGFSAVLCEVPLSEAAAAALAKECGCLFTVGGDDLSGEGIFRIRDLSSLSPAVLRDFCLAVLAKEERLLQKNVELQKKIDDLSLVARAKKTLCRTLGMTENEAHQYLEKQAMNLRVSKSDIARRVLSTYEN